MSNIEADTLNFGFTVLLGVICVSVGFSAGVWIGAAWRVESNKQAIERYKCEDAKGGEYRAPLGKCFQRALEIKP
jgi:hypothetical protein